MNQEFVSLDEKENSIVFGSVIELGGLYRSRFSDHLLIEHEHEYEVIKNRLERSGELLITDIPLVLETLYLLINEMSDGDFIALYDNVTKDDVKVLYDKLEGIYKEDK